MINKPNSVGLPAGIITSLSRAGCDDYAPLKDVPFSPQIRNQFNPDLAMWSINSVTYAYQHLCQTDNYTYPPEVEEPKLLSWYENARFFGKVMSSCGYIARIKPVKDDPTNRIGIFLRGTQTTDEWFLNIDYKQVELIMEPPGDLVKIHKGFWEFASKSVDATMPSLVEQLHRLLPTYLSPSAPNELHIGAHSMGSAVALLVATDFILRFPDVKINIYLTGCPRVGNPAFANALNSLAKNPSPHFSLFRIANTEDIITDTPPPNLERDVYSHVLISRPEDPNNIDLISFTKNLRGTWNNHHLFNYYYAMKILAEEGYGHRF